MSARLNIVKFSTKIIFKDQNIGWIYKLTASYIEFWEGSENRLNKREVFEFLDNKIKKYFLEP